MLYRQSMPITIVTARVEMIILLMFTQHVILPQLTQCLPTPCPYLRGNLGSGKVGMTILLIV